MNRCGIPKDADILGEAAKMSGADRERVLSIIHEVFDFSSVCTTHVHLTRHHPYMVQCVLMSYIAFGPSRWKKKAEEHLSLSQVRLKLFL